VAKISRGFDNIASNNDLTLKVASKSFSTIPTHKLFEMIIKDSFKCSKEFKVTQVLKGIDLDYAYIAASSPKQRSKILRSFIAIEGEHVVSTPIREKLSAADIAKKFA
jgi:hypothetical protein